MIKINLLDSVTDRARGIIDVEKEISRPRSQTALIAGVVGFLLLATCGFDYWSTSRKLSKLQEDLTEQQRIAAQVKQVKDERDQLEKKKKAVEGRIDAIQQLRSAQSGPVAVLEELRDRMENLPGLYLRKVEQKDKTLTIEGSSQDEETVTRFGRSLEFSSGLFTGMSIETVKTAPADIPVSAPTGGVVAVIPAYTNFTIRCTYNPPGSKLDAPAPGAAQQPGGAPMAAAPVLAPKPPAPDAAWLAHRLDSATTDSARRAAAACR